MKFITFALLLFLFGCGEDPAVIKQKKIDKAVEDLHEKLKPEFDKVVGLFDSLKSYSDMIGSPEVQKYRRLVEDASQDYFNDFQKQIPPKFKYNKPVKTNSFVKFQKIFSSLDKDHKDIESIYEEVIKSGNYLKLEGAVRHELKAAVEVTKVLDGDFEWYYENQDANLKELGQLRQVCKSLKFKTLIEAKKGNFDRVKVYLKRMNDFAVKIEAIKGPLMVRLVANSLQHINYSTIYEIIEKDLLNIKQLIELRNLQKSFKEPIFSDYEYIISLELYKDLIWCSASKMGQFNYIILDLNGMLFFEDDPQASLDWIKGEFEAGNFNQEQFLNRSVEFFNAFLNDVKNRVPANKLSCLKFLNKFLNSDTKSIHSELRRIFYKAYPKIILKNHVVWTRYEVCELLIALKIYEKENKSLPENMTVLLNKYINRVPVDYYTGLPVKYIKDRRVVVVKAAHGSDVEIKF